MDKNNFEKAKEFETLISDCNRVLNINNSRFRFAEYNSSYGSLDGFYCHYILPNEVVNECLDVIKKYRNKYQEEFDKLINAPQQTVEVNKQHISNKPWYKFW